jgi:hypothetical protein
MRIISKKVDGDSNISLYLLKGIHIHVHINIYTEAMETAYIYLHLF